MYYDRDRDAYSEYYDYDGDVFTEYSDDDSYAKDIMYYDKDSDDSSAYYDEDYSEAFKKLYEIPEIHDIPEIHGIPEIRYESQFDRLASMRMMHNVFNRIFEYLDIESLDRVYRTCADDYARDYMNYYLRFHMKERLHRFCFSEWMILYRLIEEFIQYNEPEYYTAMRQIMFRNIRVPLNTASRKDLMILMQSNVPRNIVRRINQRVRLNTEDYGRTLILMDNREHSDGEYITLFHNVLRNCNKIVYNFTHHPVRGPHGVIMNLKNLYRGVGRRFTLRINDNRPLNLTREDYHYNIDEIVDYMYHRYIPIRRYCDVL